MKSYTNVDSAGSLRVVPLAPFKPELAQVFSEFTDVEVEVYRLDDGSLKIQKRPVG